MRCVADPHALWAGDAPGQARNAAGHARLREAGIRSRRMSSPPGDGTFTPDAGGYPPILTTAMAADLLHVHVEYLRRMVREGRIPAHRFPGGREIRFHRDELIAWVREQPGYNRSPSAEDRVATD